MVRRVEVTVPSQRVGEVLRSLSSLEKQGCTILRGEGHSAIIFRLKDKHVRLAVSQLSKIGVGIQWGIIDVLAMQMTKPRLGIRRMSMSGTIDKKVTPKRKYRVTDRQTIEEIYEVVDSGVHLTFDYMAFCVVAGIISAVGLLTDSSVTVVASMLVSPLMGPILGKLCNYFERNPCDSYPALLFLQLQTFAQGISFGYAINDRTMMWKCVRNEIIGVLLALATGVVTAAFSLLGNKEQELTFEMGSRGQPLALLAGAIVAIPSGVGVALSVANTNINSLVGVAISAALLPPIVNAGLLVVFAMHRDSEDSLEDEPIFYRAAAISMGLFLMNWILIFAFSLITFALKKLNKLEMGPTDAVWDGRPFDTKKQSQDLTLATQADQKKILESAAILVGDFDPTLKAEG